MISFVWGGDSAVTQPWGCTPLTVEPWWAQPDCHWHCGIDIGLMTGTPLKAARGGTVAVAAYALLGIRVGGQTDWYVHIDRSVVGVGQIVAQGQLVGYSGAKVPSGGFLTGPHLHFEVQIGNLNNPATSRDPVPILAGTYGGSGTSLQERKRMYFLHDTDNNDIYVVYEDPVQFKTVKRHITLAEWNLYVAGGATARDCTSGVLQGVPDGAPNPIGGGAEPAEPLGPTTVTGQFTATIS